VKGFYTELSFVLCLFVDEKDMYIIHVLCIIWK